MEAVQAAEPFNSTSLILAGAGPRGLTPPAELPFNSTSLIPRSHWSTPTSAAATSFQFNFFDSEYLDLKRRQVELLDFQFNFFDS